jgi:hypothetical protein
MRRFSLSTWGHAHICPASAVLDTGFDSVSGNGGSALHECYSVRLRLGEIAEQQLAEICNRWNLTEKQTEIIAARVKRFQPSIPAGALSEVPLGFFEDGSVRVVRGGRGQYEAPLGLIIAGTVDLLWAEHPDREGVSALEVEWCDRCGGSGSPIWYDYDGAATLSCDCGGLPISARCPPGAKLWAADLKCGAEENVPKALRNRQARGAGFLGARWTGATDAVPALLFEGQGEGTWDVPEQALDGSDFAAIEAEIREDAKRVQEQADRQERGELLQLVTGPHSTYCHARSICPARLAGTRGLVSPEHAGDLRVGPLTAEQAKRGATMLAWGEAAMRELRESLKDYVAECGHIPLDDGRQWGPFVAGEKNVWGPKATFDALAEEPTVGPERAWDAFRTGSTMVDSVVKAAHAEQDIKQQKASVVRSIVAKAVQKEPRIKCGVHHPDQAQDLFELQMGAEEDE